MEHELMQKTPGLANGRIRAYAQGAVNPVAEVTARLGRVWQEGVGDGGWRKLKRRPSSTLITGRTMTHGREGCYAGSL
jgi:hypothetical protein